MIKTNENHILYSPTTLITIGAPDFRGGTAGPLPFDLEAEAESDSADNRATLRGGEADPSSKEASNAVGRTVVNPSDVFGKESKISTLVIASDSCVARESSVHFLVVVVVDPGGGKVTWVSRPVYPIP